MLENAVNHSTDNLALYVHWPFCLSKCPYCDFNSHVRDSIDQSLWRSALLQELQTEINENPKRRITSVFFGGGTPSLMAPGTVSDILDYAFKYWKVDRNVEVCHLDVAGSGAGQGFQPPTKVGDNRTGRRKRR